MPNQNRCSFCIKNLTAKQTTFAGACMPILSETTGSIQLIEKKCFPCNQV